MIMVSPEPDYWMHACLELARTPRPVITKGKDKGKSKIKDPVPSKPETVYDYHDGSLHDLALRKHLLRGYELFKLTHGSFASILSSLGQQALELQLERFFTVWGWRWDPEEDVDFTSHLGPPLHPQHKLLTPILDDFTANVDFDTTTFALLPPHLIPSSTLLHSTLPTCLSEHIMSRIPPPPPPIPLSTQDTSDTTTHEVDSQIEKTVPTTAQSGDKHPDTNKPGTAFMSMPNMGVEMRNIKWSWPGYLTFGKTTSAKPSVPPTPTSTPSNLANEPPTLSDEFGKKEDSVTPEGGRLSVKPPDIDTESLNEAINSEVHSPQPSQLGSPSPSSPSPAVSSSPIASSSPEPREKSASKDATPPSADEPDAVQDDQTEIQENKESSIDHESQSSVEEDQGLPASNEPTVNTDPVPAPVAEPQVEEALPSEPLPSFLTTTVYLAEGDDPCATIRRKVLHVTMHPLTLALIVDTDRDSNDTLLVEQCLATMRRLQEIISSEQSKSLEASLPTVSKILEPQDRYVISTGSYTVTSSQGFTSRSEHLFNGQQILHSDHDALEVFSRGQNPQHWHISRRGLGMDREGHAVEGEVYMEIARKESTLTDVDNELAGVIRRFVEQ
ncbi:unnamed protein product [Somion occarium]